MNNMLNLIDEDFVFSDTDFYDDFPDYMNTYDIPESYTPIYTEDPSLIWQDLDEIDLRIDLTPKEAMIMKINNTIAKKNKSSIENVDFETTESGNYRIKSKYDMFSQNYYLEPMSCFDGQQFEQFIKATERCVRTSLEYKAYISYLKNEIGLTYDAFQGNISHDVASLEMHHALFTLYDYVKIMIDYAFDNNIPVTTFSIARLIMNEHAQNRILVVMLTKNNHMLVHAGQLHIDMRQCHGNLRAFVQLYGKYIKRSPKLLRKLSDYKISLESDNFNDVSIITPSKIIDYSIQTPYDSRVINTNQLDAA